MIFDTKQAKQIIFNCYMHRSNHFHRAWGKCENWKKSAKSANGYK